MEKFKPKPLSDEYTARALKRHRQKKQAARHVVDKLGLPPQAEFGVYDVMFREQSLKKVLGETPDNNVGNQEPAPKQPNQKDIQR